MSLDLEKLRKDFLSGDHTKLVELSAKYGAYSISYLVQKHDCSKELAEDLFSDALLDLREKIIQQKITQLRNPKSYILGICLNLFKYHLRKEKRAINKKNEIEAQLYSGNSNYLDEVVSYERAREKKSIAIESFEQLDEGCKEILRLFYVEELRMKEIASLMGLANDKVAKTKKSKCYKKWREKAEELKKKYYAD